MKKMRTACGKVIIVNGEKQSSSALYRAFAAERCFKELGIDVVVWDDDSLDSVCVDNVVVCLFVRSRFSVAVADFIEQLKSVNAFLIVDFDDLVFRPELLHCWDGMKYLSDAARQEMTIRAPQYQQIIKVADCAVATTVPLAEELSRHNNNVRVIKNYPLDCARMIPSKPKDRQRNTDKFVVGYYSGTLTHQADFKQCASALANFLNQNREVVLRIVGELNLGAFVDFEGLESRICRSPIMPYQAMLLDLAECDVNIAPLQLGNRFCECKSELKYFDAGLMCVPTIASPTQPFQAVIHHGVNGFLASTSDEWYSCLSYLLRNKNLSTTIGLNARRYVLSFFGSAAQLNDYRELMNFALRYSG